MTRIRSILHATDFSRASKPAFAVALEWARRSRAQLVLVHVLLPAAHVLEDSYLSVRSWTELEAARLRQAGDGLERLVARAARVGVRAVPLVVRGIPFQEVVRIAGRRRVDLIVVGSHGRTGVARFVLGSVAERVMALAPCPVLTVRGRSPAARSRGGARR